MVLVPEVRAELMSKLVSRLWAACAVEKSVRLPVVPTEMPFTNTSAKSSAATLMLPEIRLPFRTKDCEKSYVCKSAGLVAPVTPGAHIHVAVMPDRSAVHALLPNP